MSPIVEPLPGSGGAHKQKSSTELTEKEIRFYIPELECWDLL